VQHNRNPDSAFRVLSWNVAGLRALLKNHPEALPGLAKKYNADVICLQETKLQDIHVDDPKLKIRSHLLAEEGYDSYYNCASNKKGYSGTAMFVKRRKGQENVGSNFSQGKKRQATLGSFIQTPKKHKETLSAPSDDSFAQDLRAVQVSYEVGKPEHEKEGRIIAIDFPLFSLINLYVPNSGQKLERLNYRTEQWDGDFFEFAKKKETDTGMPVIYLGDLNVSHKAADTWNDGAKHLAKQAGTTPEERESFQKQLDGGFVDVFRHCHPNAQGWYTYWSQRAKNRDPNKGLRLDYFVSSRSLVQNLTNNSKQATSRNRVKIKNSSILYDQLGSDHCPILLELEIRK